MRNRFLSVVAAAALAPALLAQNQQPSAQSAPAAGHVQPVTPQTGATDLLPSDERLVRGEMDNGMHYIVRANAKPPGRMAVWLHVSAGSLDETEQQRGLAHFLEHMAFEGSEHFPPGTVVPLFESFGMTFGHDQNAFTSFDQTVYQLTLPDTKAETIDKAMAFLDDVAQHLTLPPPQIDAQRQVILQERTSRLGSIQRVQDYYFERVAPGSTLGHHIPIGTEEAIKSFQQPDLASFYHQWYVPANMTVLAAGDLDPKALEQAVKQHFSGGARAPAPAMRPVGIAPYAGVRAIVAADPELTTAEVGFNWLTPAPPAVKTMADYRQRLVEAMGTWCFDRRLQQKVSQGKVSFQSGGAQISDLFGAGRLTAIIAHGDADKWKQMLTDSATELRRATLHGFTDQELGDARKEMQSNVERAVETEAGRSDSAVLGEIDQAVENGDTITSSQQDLEITKAILPQITLAEVNGRFAALFDSEKPLSFVLQAPSKGEVPTEEQLIALGQQAFWVKPEAETAPKEATALLEKAPEPAPVEELTEEPQSHVWSGWLADGARVHFRRMDYLKDQVGVAIIVAGGEIQENAENRGITQASLTAWAQPATSKLSSTDIQKLLTGKKASTGTPQTTADAIILPVGGSPEELETGMQLAYLLLTDPVIEPTAFQRWAQRKKQSIAQSKLSPQGVFGDLLADTLYPADAVRVRPLTIEQVDHLSLEGSQAWLRDLCAKAPMEVAIVGDIDKDKAMDLAQRYLGNLPKRERISKSTLDPLRTVAYRPGPLEAHREVQTQTQQAIVMAGLQGPALKDLEDVRLINLATRVLTTRATATIREKQQLAYSPSVSASPGTEYPRLGIIAAISPTDPKNAEPLVGAFTQLFDEFAKSGPTAEEMETAKKQVAADLDNQLRQPGYWIQTLATLDYHERTIESILSGPAAYAAFTAEQVKAAWDKYDKPEQSFRLWVVPAANAPGPEGVTGAVPDRPGGAGGK